MLYKKSDNIATVWIKHKAARVVSSVGNDYMLHSYDVGHATFCSLFGTLLQQGVTVTIFFAFVFIRSPLATIFFTDNQSLCWKNNCETPITS